MIFVVDTSSAQSAIALLDGGGGVVGEEVHPSGRTFDLPARFRSLVGNSPLTRIAVATGPGSFTGLRVGASFAVGLAVGLKIPIAPLHTLAIQAARSAGPALAVSEAGRGRVYFLPPGGEAAIGEPQDLPKQHPAVGWLRPATQSAMAAAGLQMAAEDQLLGFALAAARLLKSAPDVAAGSVKLEYMQTFGART